MQATVFECGLCDIVFSYLHDSSPFVPLFFCPPLFSKIFFHLLNFILAPSFPFLI